MHVAGAKWRSRPGCRECVAGAPPAEGPPTDSKKGLPRLTCNAYTTAHYMSECSKVVSVCAVLFLLVSADPAPAADEKAPFDRTKAKDGGLGMPTPYDKFLALDAALAKGKIDWAKAYRTNSKAIDTDAFKDAEVAIPMALGVRIADGVMAVKAKDAELLNQCSTDIEKLAKKMGIADGELSRARAVKTAANKGAWLQVFLELGFFQQDIMKRIEDDKNPARGTLLIVSGWMQGARYTTGLVQDNYTPELSNILREPMLAKALLAKLEGLPDGVKDRPAVATLRKVLPGIVTILDIPTTGTISKENVSELRKLADDAVKAATQGK
jgi:hypothetical protein